MGCTILGCYIVDVPVESAGAKGDQYEQVCINVFSLHYQRSNDKTGDFYIYFCRLFFFHRSERIKRYAVNNIYGHFAPEFERVRPYYILAQTPGDARVIPKWNKY